MNLSKRFPYLYFVRGIHWSSSDSPHQRSINGSFEVCFAVNLNKLFNGRIAGDLRRHVLLWRQYIDFWQLDLDITTTLAGIILIGDQCVPGVHLLFLAAILNLALR